MNPATRKEIEEAIEELRKLGGDNDPELKKVIEKLEKVLEGIDKSD